MTAGWHVVAKLLTVSRMSKVEYGNKVLACIFISWFRWDNFFTGESSELLMDSPSDGTHSLQRIHWWAVMFMLNFFKSIQMKLFYLLYENTFREHFLQITFWEHFQQVFIFVELPI